MQTYPTHLTSLLNILEEMKAVDITTLDVTKKSSFTDYMILCCARSLRHVNAIAEEAAQQMKHLGHPCQNEHALNNSDWVLLDFGNFVLHVMLPDTRAFYNLEELWQSPT